MEEGKFNPPEHVSEDDMWKIVDKEFPRDKDLELRSHIWFCYECLKKFYYISRPLEFIKEAAEVLKKLRNQEPKGDL